MSEWALLAHAATEAIVRASDGGDVDEALRAVRAFRTWQGDDKDRERREAYAKVFGFGIKALRLLERSRYVMAYTGDPADEANAASAGTMIGNAALSSVVRALNALESGARDTAAEEALDRLAAGPLPQAASRLEVLYKLAVNEHNGAARAADAEDDDA